MSDFRDDLRNFERRFKLNVEKLLSPDFLREIGDKTTTIIYKRTKNSKGADGGRETKLAPLSKRYIERRQGIARFTTRDGRFVEFRVKPPRLGKFGSPAKSNLTMTGQMLDSMDYKITKNGVTIFIPASRRKDSELTNAELAKFVTEQGRRFFELTTDEVITIQRMITNKLRQLAKNV